MIYGLDIGGTKVELAIFDNELNREKSWRVATPKQVYSEFLATISEMIQEADKIVGALGSVGIGLPGFIDQQGCAVTANIPCINGQPLSIDLSHRISRKVSFENDVNTFILSEVNGGAASESKHALGVVLGTGVAGGLCINGELYYGKQNIAGEYGHMPLPGILLQRHKFPLRQCSCRIWGCIEQYLAGPGLLWMCSHFGGEYDSIPSLIQAVRDNDAKALKIFAAYIDCLGCFFAQLTLIFDPDVIVIGGGLSNISEIYQQLPHAINNYLFDGVVPPAIVPPKFGDSSGVRGAALIGQQARLYTARE